MNPIGSVFSRKHRWDVCAHLLQAWATMRNSQNLSGLWFIPFFCLIFSSCRLPSGQGLNTGDMRSQGRWASQQHRGVTATPFWLSCLCKGILIWLLPLSYFSYFFSIGRPGIILRDPSSFPQSKQERVFEKVIVFIWCTWTILLFTAHFFQNRYPHSP